MAATGGAAGEGAAAAEGAGGVAATGGAAARVAAATADPTNLGKGVRFGMVRDFVQIQVPGSSNIIRSQGGLVQGL